MNKAKERATQLQVQIATLLMARVRISSGSDTYLCHAIYGLPEERSLKAEISDMLRGEYTYCGWVERFHPKEFNEMELQQHISDINPFRMGRLSWIDDMVHKKRVELATLRAEHDI